MKIANIEVALIDHCGTDLSTVNAARVSMDKESNWEYDEWIDPPTGETIESAAAKGYPVRHVMVNPHLSMGDVKLIQYLAKHQHFSPFNHAFLSFRIKAPIFCARQLQKHRFMPWNEVSRRYVDDEPEFYVPDLRKRAGNVKQGSLDETVSLDYDPLSSVKTALSTYNWLLADGVAPEVARAFLPQNMMTEWVWGGTLGAFLDMLVLRLNPHTQKETRDVAEKIAEVVKQLFPESYRARIE